MLRSPSPQANLALRAYPLVRRAGRYELCPLRACEGLACQGAQVWHNVHEVADVPQLDDVIGAGTGQCLAIWAERQRVDRDGLAGEGWAGVAGEDCDLLLGGQVPQMNRPISVDAGQGLAIWAERHRGNRAAVAGQWAPDL